MPERSDDVRCSGQTRSNRQRVKTALLTHNGHRRPPTFHSAGLRDVFQMSSLGRYNDHSRHRGGPRGGAISKGWPTREDDTTKSSPELVRDRRTLQAQQPATGETIRDGGTWRVYELTRQMDAILFWDRFKGRWLRGSEFHYPERPTDFPKLKTAHQLAEVQRPRHAVILAAILIAAARAVFQGAAFFLLSMLHPGCYRSGAEGVGNKERLNSIRYLCRAQRAKCSIEVSGSLARSLF